jgi:hypothetical protein
MTQITTDALVIRDDDGTVYAIPQELLRQCEVSEADEVQGYLNPQPIPPGRTMGSFHVLGFAPVTLLPAVAPGDRHTIIFVGGRT